MNSSDNGQDNTKWQSVQRITTIPVLTLQKIKLNDNQYGELNNISSDNKEDKGKQQSVWRITSISVLTLDKKKLKDNQYEELQQNQF